MDGISLILPVYNQAAALQKAIALWSETLEKLKRPCEIVVVDDGSTDATAEALAALGQPNLIRHSLVTRQGYGAALVEGFRTATKELFLVSALDYPYAPDDLKLLLKSLNQKHEVTGQPVSLVSGCRMDLPYVGGRATRQNFLRYATRILFGYLPEKPPGFCSAHSAAQWWRLRLQFGIRFHDPFSAFKLFRREVIERMIFQSKGRFLLAELLAKATFLGNLMDEVPIAQQRSPMPWNAEPELSPDQYRIDRRKVFRRQEFARPAKLADAAPPETVPV